MTQIDVLLSAPTAILGGVSGLALRGATLTYAFFEPGRLGVIDLETLRAQTLLDTPAGLSDLSLADDGTLYLANVWACTISRLSPGRRDAEVLVSSERNAARVAAHGEHLAWGGGTGSSQAVRVASLKDLRPRNVATKIGHVTSMQADGRGVLFTTNGTPRSPGGVWSAGWEDSQAQRLSDGMRFCKRASRGPEGVVYFGAEYARPRGAESGLWRVREGDGAVRVARVIDPRGISPDEGGGVAATYDGTIVTWRDDGTVHTLAALGVPVVNAVADARWVYVGTARPWGPERAVLLRVAR